MTAMLMERKRRREGKLGVGQGPAVEQEAATAWRLPDPITLGTVMAKRFVTWLAGSGAGQHEPLLAKNASQHQHTEMMRAGRGWPHLLAWVHQQRHPRALACQFHYVQHAWSCTHAPTSMLSFACPSVAPSSPRLSPMVLLMSAEMSSTCNPVATGGQWW